MSSAGPGERPPQTIRLVSSMEGPDGAPVLILANPIGTTRAIWDAQARVLRRDFRLLRFELRGHGTPGAQSDAPPGPYSIAELGTDVLGLMREYGVATAGYCGISIGGMTGLWLAANAPERISSLVVCCAAITRARRDQGAHAGHRGRRGPGRTAVAGRDDRDRHRGLQAPGHQGHLAPGSLPDTRTRHRRHPGPPRGIIG